MKNQITILFAGGLLAANAVMAAPATAHIGGTFVDLRSAVGKTISAQILSPVKQIALADNSESDYYSSGNSKYNSKDFKGAIADYDRSIELNPSHHHSYRMRSVVKSILGDKKGSIADLDKAISLNPQNGVYYYERGQNKLDLGDKQGAVSDWRKAFEFYSAAKNFTWANITTTKINEATRSTQTQTQIQTQPSRQVAQDAIAYYNSANSKLQTGNYQGAIADYTQAININPQFVNAYLDRAKAKVALRDKEGQLEDNQFAAYIFNHRIVPGVPLANNTIFVAELNQVIKEYTQATDEFNLHGQESRDRCKNLKNNIHDKGVKLVQLIENNVNVLPWDREYIIAMRNAEVQAIRSNAVFFRGMSQCGL